MAFGLVLAAVGAGAVLATSVDVDLASTRSQAANACGSSTVATVARVDSLIARRIYTGELASRGVRADIRHITSSAALRAALASSNRAAAYAAVHALVYTPHWHIVRLRLLQRGRVLADVGGPDVIAPVSGTLSVRGRVAGRFVMSVQDDLGYVKLVTRFLGIPIELYRNGSPVMGTLLRVPAAAKNGELVTVGQTEYETVVVRATAFPAGTLDAALFVPVPPGAVAAQSCAGVSATAWGDAARLIAARFVPLKRRYGAYRALLSWLSGGLVLTRPETAHGGSRGLAGIPDQGTTRYARRKWDVFSWTALDGERTYLLLPPMPGLPSAP
jgi:hypothetical protein